MPTFGNTIIGTADSAPANYLFGSKFTVAEGGTISKITAYVARYSGTCLARVALYSDVGGLPSVKLAEGTSEVSITTAGWYDFPISYTFTAGTYWLVLATGTLINLYFTTGTTGNGMYCTNGYFTYPSFPNPIASYAPYLSTGILSIYATYTATTPSPLQASISATTPTTITWTKHGYIPSGSFGRHSSLYLSVVR